MTTLLTILVLLVAVAALEAAIQQHDAPPPAVPRRNYDVLAPAAPRLGATRLDNVDAQTLHDLRLARHIFGPKAGTVVTIRPEVRDGRQ